MSQFVRAKIFEDLDRGTSKLYISIYPKILIKTLCIYLYIEQLEGFIVSDQEPLVCYYLK